MHKQVKNHIVLGDYNINILDNGICDGPFFLNFLEYGFIPLISSVTRPNMRMRAVSGGSCIDNIFFKSSQINFQAFKLNTPFTDHFSLISSINGITGPYVVESSKYNRYIGYKILEENVRKCDWNFIFEITDPNLAFDSIVDKIKGFIATLTKKIKN